ncbi:MAG TPA: type II secretion system protein [Anaeromyxobacteraceae bacterium]|nr:type II secretion system protein [Anaeromyxobacteraceae bacterium]
MSRRGFTLLEVMVALAILAAGLVGISELVGGAMRNHARAKQLEVATLLARGKMAEIEDHYEEEGFRDFDEADDGTFDDEGHPEVSWALEVKKPTVDLGGTAACRAFLGGGEIADLLGAAAPSAQGEPAAGPSPLAAAMEGYVKQQCALFGETLKKSLREARLTVSWRDGKAQESFRVVTLLAVIQPRKGQP